MYLSPCTYFMYYSLINVVKAKLFKALNNHHLDKQISVKIRKSPCTICCSGTFFEFKWFGTKIRCFQELEERINVEGD